MGESGDAETTFTHGYTGTRRPKMTSDWRSVLRNVSTGFGNRSHPWDTIFDELIWTRRATFGNNSGMSPGITEEIIARHVPRANGHTCVPLALPVRRPTTHRTVFSKPRLDCPAVLGKMDRRV